MEYLFKNRLLAFALLLNAINLTYSMQSSLTSLVSTKKLANFSLAYATHRGSYLRSKYNKNKNFRTTNREFTTKNDDEENIKNSKKICSSKPFLIGLTGALGVFNRKYLNGYFDNSTVPDLNKIENVRILEYYHGLLTLALKMEDLSTIREILERKEIRNLKSVHLDANLMEYEDRMALILEISDQSELLTAALKLNDRELFEEIWQNLKKKKKFEDMNDGDIAKDMLFHQEDFKYTWYYFIKGLEGLDIGSENKVNAIKKYVHLERISKMGWGN